MQIGDRHFGGRGQEKRVVLQAVHVCFELGQLRGADHALAPDEKRRADFLVTVRPRVQIEQKIEQRPLQPRARSGETRKAAAADFCRPLRIE